MWTEAQFSNGYNLTFRDYDEFWYFGLTWSDIDIEDIFPDNW